MNMQQMTEQQAIDYARSGAWRELDTRQRAVMFLYQERLCMPFDEGHRALQDALGRPVFTHEFGIRSEVEQMKAELEGRLPASTQAQLLARLSAWCDDNGKTLIIHDE